MNSATGLPNNGAAMFETVGAATFTDLISASSPNIAALSAGFVRYKFAVDGLTTALGAAAPYFFGETYMVLDVQQNGGAVSEVMNAHVLRGTNGLIRNQAPPAGWTAGIGSLSGGVRFSVCSCRSSREIPHQVIVSNSPRCNKLNRGGGER